MLLHFYIRLINVGLTLYLATMPSKAGFQLHFSHLPVLKRKILYKRSSIIKDSIHINFN